jgi:hypothetical protein
MDKVYCKNCKWGKRELWIIYCKGYNKIKNKNRVKIIKETGLKYISEKYIIHRFSDIYNTIEGALPRRINKDNNCVHYKRKWWKFWV